jgi:hypothetical protein
MASKWLLMLPTCVIERISVRCFASAGSRVCSSETRMPGTAVSTGL